MVKKTWAALGEVYRAQYSLVVTFCVAVLLFLFNLLVTNYRILFANFSFEFFFSFILGSLRIMELFSLILLVMISLLAGIVVTMMFFLLLRQVRGAVGAGLGGFFLSVAAPSCPSCAMGLLSVLGFGGFLALLPFKGRELGVLALLLLGFSLVHLSRKVTAATCPVPVQKKSS